MSLEDMSPAETHVSKKDGHETSPRLSDGKTRGSRGGAPDRSEKTDEKLREEVRADLTIRDEMVTIENGPNLVSPLWAILDISEE